MFETMPSVMAMVAVAGLKIPKIATACMVAYCIGSYFYLTGCEAAHAHTHKRNVVDDCRTAFSSLDAAFDSRARLSHALLAMTII